MVVSLARKHGAVRRSKVMELCRITGKQATRLLGTLIGEGRIVMTGERRHAVYALAQATNTREKKPQRRSMPNSMPHRRVPVGFRSTSMPRGV